MTDIKLQTDITFKCPSCGTPCSYRVASKIYPLIRSPISCSDYIYYYTYGCSFCIEDRRIVVDTSIHIPEWYNHYSYYSIHK